MTSDGVAVVYCVSEDTGVTSDMEVVCHLVPVGGVDRPIRILSYDESVILNDRGDVPDTRIVAEVRARSAEIARVAGPTPRAVHRSCQGLHCRGRLAEARFDPVSGRIEIVSGTRLLLAKTLVRRVIGTAAGGEQCSLVPNGLFFHEDDATRTVIVRMRFDDGGSNPSRLCWSPPRRPLVSESEVYVLHTP